MPVSVDRREIAFHPVICAPVSYADQHVEPIDGRSQSVSNEVRVVSEPAARINHDQRNVPSLFVNSTHFALQHAVRPAILALVGGEYDDRVFDYAIRKGMQ